VNTSAKEQFRADFWSTIKKEYESVRLKRYEEEKYSNYNNIEWKSLHNTIAYIFIMTDDVLFNKINECVRNGYATKSEVCGLFNVKEHVMGSRINISHDENLRIYYNQLIDNMVETYSLANPSSFNTTKKNENGEIVECGYVHAIKNYASVGSTKKEICEYLQINPASWNEFPALLQAYNQGNMEFESFKSDGIIDGISISFIRNNHFIEVVIPAIQREAFEHKVWLIEEEYSISVDEDGKETKKLVRTKRKQKLVPGNKDMRDIDIRLSSGKLLEQIGLSRDDSRKVKSIPMFDNELVTEQGTFEIPVKEEDYEPAKK